MSECRRYEMTAQVRLVYDPRDMTSSQVIDLIRDLLADARVEVVSIELETLASRVRL